LREVPKDEKLMNYYKNNLKQLVVKIINSKIMEIIKKCCKCKIDKSIINFGKLKSSPDSYRYDCKDCRKNHRILNKEKIQIKQKEYYNENKQELLEKNKKYRLENIEQINKQRKEYREREEIKKHTKEKNQEYLPIKKEKIKQKRKENLNFQISEILRSKVHKMIKGKKTSYQNIVGCDIDFLKKWLEFRFDKNMNWDNLGKYWEIDHILPISAFNFNNENEKNICFHWTNLQPLSSFENKSKSNHLQMHYYFNNIINVNRFIVKNNSINGYQTIRESLLWLQKKDWRYGKNPSYNFTTKVVNEMDNPQPSS